MAPIINPLWFYLIDVIVGLDDIFFGVAFVLGFLTIVVLIIGSDNIDFENSKTIKALKRVGVTIITCFVLISLTPSEDTCYKMMTAALITPNNIATVGEAATDVVDYIIESVDKLLEEENKE